MKKLSVVVVFVMLFGCSHAPQPKQPSESNRQPVNKTMPVEVQGDTK